ncbi:glycosyltransferase family 4 protein [Sphingobacterium faecium]|uniref:glycosyltransferase family 4 protein n=1 Tax=Sphingobacterium faecium TaxID=34087 RepID=UPI003207A8C9
MKRSKSILIHAWTLYKKDGQYYIPFTHWVYLNEIVKYYDKICLLSPTDLHLKDEVSYEAISCFPNVEVYELPYTEGYIAAIKYFFHYNKAYKELSSHYDVVYARYPIPFGWLQKFYFQGKRRIIHFVGDPMDTIINNPSLSFIKKSIYRLFFKPEHAMFMAACKGANVYTNGHHLAERLETSGIKANPLISSTLSDNDFYFEDKEIDGDAPKIIYVGYLRKAKGVETVVKAFGLLQFHKPDAKLTIVGYGESELLLKSLVENQNLQNVKFEGHIDNREKLNQLLRENDIFCFASLSEGSPRVILEAMANGLAILSTPVGSLPTTFEDNKEIVFANFNDEKDFSEKLLKLSSDFQFYNSIRLNSFNKVSNYKIENFLKTIFYEA